MGYLIGVLMIRGILLFGGLHESSVSFVLNPPHAFRIRLPVLIGPARPCLGLRGFKPRTPLRFWGFGGRDSGGFEDPPP